MKTERPTKHFLILYNLGSPVFTKIFWRAFFVVQIVPQEKKLYNDLFIFLTPFDTPWKYLLLVEEERLLFLRLHVSWSLLPAAAFVQFCFCHATPCSRLSLELVHVQAVIWRAKLKVQGRVRRNCEGNDRALCALNSAILN